MQKFEYGDMEDGKRVAFIIKKISFPNSFTIRTKINPNVYSFPPLYT